LAGRRPGANLPPHNNNQKWNARRARQIRKPDRAARDRDPHREHGAAGFAKISLARRFRAVARRRIPKFLYGYISGGAETDAALRDNRKAFDEYGFVPRVLNDVSGRDQTTTLFGKTYASPFGIPPMGSSALAAYRGDIVLTKAAKAENVPMISAPRR
jgi:hypothetical protein